MAQPQVDDAGQSAARKYTNADLEPSDDLAGEGTAQELPKVMLEWSKNPAVHEADLRRRQGNPLYMEGRREINRAELFAAKRIDSEKQWQELENFIDLVSDKKRMARYESASQMADALLRIDEGTWNALRVGGEAYSLAKSIQKMRADLMRQWRESSAGDPGVKALLDAEDRLPEVKTDSRAIRFIALIQAEDGPIPTHEIGTALMSEDVASIGEVYSSLRGELKTNMLEQLTLVLQDVGRDQIEFDDKDQKVLAVAKLLKKRPADFGIRRSASPR